MRNTKRDYMIWETMDIKGILSNFLKNKNQNIKIIITL